MRDATPALRLLGEMERLQGADDPGAAETSSAPQDTPMTALLATLVEHDFDLTRAIVDSAYDA